MKKIITLLLLAFSIGSMGAKTLRVNNIESENAEFTTVSDALAAAEDGDVIILEASPESYGKIIVDKSVTLRGEGYFLDANGIGNEGASSSCAERIKVNADGAVISSLYVSFEIAVNADDVVVTRCNCQSVTLGVHLSFDSRCVKNCIVHQNYVRLSVGGENYSGTPTNIQITNNIFVKTNDGGQVSRLNNSLIAYNTFAYNLYKITGTSSIKWTENSVIEHNIGGMTYNGGKSNTYNNNYDPESENIYKLYDTPDSKYKEIDASLTTTAGAFAGDDPYRLSGLANAPIVEDLIVPTSVEQGNELKVTLKIGQPK